MVETHNLFARTEIYRCGFTGNGYNGAFRHINIENQRELVIKKETVDVVRRKVYSLVVYMGNNRQTEVACE